MVVGITVELIFDAGDTILQKWENEAVSAHFLDVIEQLMKLSLN